MQCVNLKGLLYVVVENFGFQSESTIFKELLVRYCSIPQTVSFGYVYCMYILPDWKKIVAYTFISKANQSSFHKRLHCHKLLMWT